jgi:hypothetical protein
LSQLKVWGEHCQFGGSLRGVCGLFPNKKLQKLKCGYFCKVGKILTNAQIFSFFFFKKKKKKTKEMRIF